MWYNLSLKYAVVEAYGKYRYSDIITQEGYTSCFFLKSCLIFLKDIIQLDFLTQLNSSRYSIKSSRIVTI